MIDIWRLLLRPHKIDEVAKPLDQNKEHAELSKAKREFDEVFREFQNERESWKEIPHD